jgi:hypothetical protein
MADIYDVIELTVDIPEKNLRAGLQGTIVHKYNDQTYEVEFTYQTGETLALLALRSEQFIVVWRAETQAWVPVVEQAAMLIAQLPAESAQEVLDFARFLSVRSQHAD